jgi:RNA polymerase sigma-70 factor (ECF subfamily)
MTMQAAALDQIVDDSLPLDSQDPDEELMLRYARGDGRAFEILFHRHQRRVYGFIWRFTGVGWQADDVFQEVFLRVIRNRKGYRLRSAKFTTWLYTITRSVCIDAIRKQKRRAICTSFQDSEETERAVSLLETVQETQRDEVYEKEVSAAVEQLVLRLPQEQREVLLLRERLNLPFQEIARITGCRIGTVKSRMRYALQALRRGLVAEGLVQ